MNWNIHILFSLAAMVAGNSLECLSEYDWTMNICEESEVYGNLVLSDFEPQTLTTPLDPKVGCKNYKVGVSCQLMVVARPGQRIQVKTGNYYNLANRFCSSCGNCDSFTVDGRCVKPTHQENTDVFISNTSIALVNFTSYAATDADTKAQLVLQAFGCAKIDLTQDENVDLVILNDHSLSIHNESYTAKVTCPEGTQLSDTQQRETTVLCKRSRDDEDGTLSYNWEFSNGLVTCSSSLATVAIVVAVVIFLVLAVVVILVVLFCLGKMPCQSDNQSVPNSDVSEPKADVESAVVVRRAKKQVGVQQAMEEENLCIHDNQSNNNSNSSNQALITAEVANYWNRNDNHG